MTLKAIGHQWYWSYEYPDHGDFTFDALMLEDDELEEGQPRLLATDEAVVLPVGAKIRLLTTADDVIPLLGHPGARRQDGFRARPGQRDLVPDQPRGHLLRSVLGALRHLARLHADHDRGGVAGGLRRLGGNGARRIRSGER